MIKHKDCEFEPQIVKAVKSGFSGDEISAHLKSCSSCRETAKIVQFFQKNLRNEQTLPHLPAAGFLWWKSRIIEKRRAAERAVQPIIIAQIVASVVAFITFVWLLFLKSTQFNFLDDAFNQAFASMEVFVAPLVAGVICFAFICATLVFALDRYLLEK